MSSEDELAGVFFYPSIPFMRCSLLPDDSGSYGDYGFDDFGPLDDMSDDFGHDDVAPSGSSTSFSVVSEKVNQAFPWFLFAINKLGNERICENCRERGEGTPWAAKYYFCQNTSAEFEVAFPSFIK